MVAVNYLWNPINDNIVREFDESGNTIAEYTAEPDLYGNVVSQNRGGATSYLHFDGQGNTTELTNDAGVVTDVIRYSAYGELVEQSGSTESPFQYVGQTGYYVDDETRTLSVRHRPLDQFLGRWLSTEPSVLESEVAISSDYRDCENNPSRLKDPPGVEPLTCLMPFFVPGPIGPLFSPFPNAKGRKACQVVRVKVAVDVRGKPICPKVQAAVLESTVAVIEGSRVLIFTWWCVECQDLAGKCGEKQTCSIALKTEGTAAPIHVCACFGEK